MPKIDSKMMQIYRESIKTDTKLGKKISEEEALLLINRAHEISKNTIGNCFCPPETRKGSKYLSRLLKLNKKDFTPEGRMMVQQYILTGRKQMISNTERRETNINSLGTGLLEIPNYNNTIRDVNERYPTRTNNRSVTERNHIGNLPTIMEEDGTGGDSHSTRNYVGTRTERRVSSHEIPRGISNNLTTNNGEIPNPGTLENFRDRNLTNNTVNLLGMDIDGIRNTRVGNGINGTGGSIETRPNGTGINTEIRTDENSIGGSVESRPNGEVNTEIGNIPPSVPEPTTNVPIENVGGIETSSPVEGIYGTEILKFVATKPTWGCHWFPMQETKPGGDPINNLYAPGGPLDKLDMINGKGARLYEYEHSRKAFGSGKQYSWWGHCNNASEASCLLKAPKHGVVMKTMDGGEVKFSKNDIQGLLVKVAPSLVSKTDFRGDRFNGSGDKKGDPTPEVFLSVIKDWAKDGLPFVLDIDNSAQVWNFPYDQVKIYESSKAPEGFNVSGVGDGVKYYHIEMEGTGYKEKARIYDFYIEEGNGGVKSGWIKTDKNHYNPDFMWRPHPKGDLMDRSTWVLGSRPNTNTKIDPQLIYDIYMQSLS